MLALVADNLGQMRNGAATTVFDEHVWIILALILDLPRNSLEPA